VTKHVSTKAHQRANVRELNGNTQCPHQKEVQISFTTGKHYADSALRFEGTNLRELSGKGCEYKRCILQWDVG
jgi:hypothetical protein